MSDPEQVCVNLFGALSAAPGQEQHRVLRATDSVRIERIVSPPGYADAPDSWYDQAWGEWVAVLSGSAALRFAHETAPRLLQAGDSLSIAAHVLHRVEWTDPEQPTIWLAVHHR